MVHPASPAAMPYSGADSYTWLHLWSLLQPCHQLRVQPRGFHLLYLLACAFQFRYIPYMLLLFCYMVWTVDKCKLHI
jgi:hypothetical protein